MVLALACAIVLAGGGLVLGLLVAAPHDAGTGWTSQSMMVPARAGGGMLGPPAGAGGTRRGDVAVQGQQVRQMQSWLRQWYPEQPVAQYRPMMRDLTRLSGEDLDRAFQRDMAQMRRWLVQWSGPTSGGCRAWRAGRALPPVHEPAGGLPCWPPTS
ncbi:hypothetical protein [Isoptericola sp. NPDC057191]|uniref:hypothetical protein n=1 Tax=Isoptericola sp. NPDC057191 TaxID=3346041 RepID=UPI00363D1D80